MKPLLVAKRTLSLVLAAVFFGSLGSVSSPASAQTGDALTPQQTEQIGVDAYIYGYSLITMELTRRSFVNVASASPSSAPMGQFANMQAYPAVSDHRVTAPNADTLYSTAWLDVTEEPYVLSIPNMHGRYFLMPMLDGWTTVFQVPGKRTTGTGAQKYLITGPDWQGSVPAGVTQYKSPTGLVWILGRIYCTGTPSDYKAVHALQAQLSLVPLSSYGKPYTPPAGSVNPSWQSSLSVRDRVDSMSAAEYFALLAQLMKTNRPVLPQDAAIVAEMARIGLVAGQDWDTSKLSPAVQTALQGSVKTAQLRIKQFASKGLTVVNGWNTLTKTGIYGADYVDRAFVTAVGLGANRPQDAQYPFTQALAGQPLLGSNTYVLHFARAGMPPVGGFWSITMYDTNFFFVPNALNKQTVSERDALKHNSDGSLDLYFSHVKPAKVPQANWLPGPAGKFILMLRMYWPKAAVLDGTWKVPPLKSSR
jgi:hypothetical protein